MEDKPELPSGWKWVKLVEMCEIIRGNEPGSNNYNINGEGNKFIRVSDVSKGRVQDFFTTSENIVLCNKDDLIMAFDGSPGAIATGIEGAIASGIRIIRPKNDLLLKEFLFYVLQSEIVQKTIKDYSFGATIQHASKSITNIIIPLPQLSEQKRIAAKLQEMMSEIDQARTACEKQLEAAKSLPSAYLCEVFESPESQKWQKKRLGEVCQFEYGSGLPERDRINGSVPVFGSNGIVGHHSVSITKGSTIIIGRKGSIGQVNYSTESCWPIDTTYYIDSSKTNCELIWLYWLLKWLRLDSLNKATGVPGLNREDAYSQLIPLPSLSEQKRIASYLKEKIDQAEQLRASIEKELKTINSLPQSILSKAFKGEL